MRNSELLEREITDVCKANEVDFKWTYNDVLCIYKLRFEKAGKKFDMMINEKDICILPISLIMIEIKSKIRNFVNTGKAKVIFDKLLRRLQSLCDDNNIHLTHYHNPELDSYSFKFEKYGKAFRYMITIDDLMHKQDVIIFKEIDGQLIKLYDAARSKIS